jgi:hypothetical protein
MRFCAALLSLVIQPKNTLPFAEHDEDHLASNDKFERLTGGAAVTARQNKHVENS